MTVDKKLTVLLAEFGQSIGIASLVFNDQGFCALTFDSRISVQFQVNEPTGRVFIYAPLGPIAEERKLQVYEVLLRGNLFWDATGGGTLAIEGDDKPFAILMLDTDWERLNVSDLAATVERFVNTAEMWAEMIRDDVTIDPQQDASGCTDGEALGVRS